MLKRIYSGIRSRSMYLLINARKIILNISTSADKNFIKFRSNGFLKIHSPGLSEILNVKLDSISNSNLKQIKNDDVIFDKSGNIKTVWLDLEDEFFWNYIFTEEVYNNIANYYNHEKFYLRNRPSLSVVYPNEQHGAQDYHVDWGLNQITLMINISDVDDKTTHMEYLQGSNKKNWFSAPNRKSKSFERTVRNFLSSGNFSSVTTKAPRDTIFIFDAGNGIHRQVIGGKRIILHMNFVNNLAFTNWNSSWRYSPSMEKHWHIKKTDKLISLIEKSKFTKQVFDLVFHELKPRLFQPAIYSDNFES